MEQALVIFCISCGVFCARNSFKVGAISSSSALGYNFCNFSANCKLRVSLFTAIFFIFGSVNFFSQSFCRKVITIPFTFGGRSSLERYKSADEGVTKNKAKEGFIWVK